MGRIRHYYHKRFGHHGRFHLAVVLTIVVVTYLLVPWVVELVDASRGYGPSYYEPKDATRQDFIIRYGLKAQPSPSWKLAVNVGLVCLVVVVWVTILPFGLRR